MKILSFGEIIWDIYPNKRCIGGAPLNFAAHAVKSGAEAYLLSSVGEDALGKEAIRILENLGVNCELVAVNPEKSTGTCTVLLDKDGIPSYTIDEDRAYDHIKACADISSYRFSAISFGTLALRSKNNRHVLKEILENKAGKVFCDLNLRLPFYDKELVDWAMSVSDIVKINEDELKYLTKGLIEKSAAHVSDLLRIISEKYENLELILYTCGENGAYVYEKTKNKLYYRPAERVEVVSTVGAGDSFGAVFLTEYLRGESIESCLCKATHRSAKVVACEEAVPVSIH